MAASELSTMETAEFTVGSDSDTVPLVDAEGGHTENGTYWQDWTWYGRDFIIKQHQFRDYP